MRGYHDGQRAVQRRTGDTTVAERLERGIRPALPDVAQEFLAGLPLLFVAAADPAGRVWASVLSGPPGFIDTPDDRTLTAAALPPAGSPLARALGAGPAAVGLLGIEPQTRRRMRVNGTGTLGPDGLSVRTEQVYSNCPKYIQRRHVTAAGEGAAPATAEREQLTAADRRLVAAADTFVIATAGPDGADASHRGGTPGFVAVHDATRLSFPDYVGNTMYMTLGNLEANPRAGLLLLDWATGDTLQLSGRGVIDWSPERAAAVPGAQRIVDFTVEHVVATSGAVPYHWALDERSRFNPPVAGTLGAVAGLGDPTSYLELPDRAPVYSADGKEIGKVEHVLADPDADIFDGLVIATRHGPGGLRFVDAPLIDRLYTGGVVVTVDAASAELLPRPSENPAALEVEPDDTVPDDLRDKLRRAWDWISGNY